ncbi:MAG: DUF3830 family protein [Saprospiraceae bacterium]
MTGFQLRTASGLNIQFELYLEAAPITSNAFLAALPFTQTWIHASVSGQEIWTAKAPALNIIQENASVFTKPGEVVIGPIQPMRNKVAGCMGIYYGEGKGLDGANIFARVVPADMEKLLSLGKKILYEGGQEIILLAE